MLSCQGEKCCANTTEHARVRESPHIRRFEQVNVMVGKKTIIEYKYRKVAHTLKAQHLHTTATTTTAADSSRFQKNLTTTSKLLHRSFNSPTYKTNQYFKLQPTAPYNN